MNLSELMAEEETRLRAEAQAEIAAEKAAWDALTPEQQAAVIAAREAKYEAMFEASNESDEDLCGECGESEDDCECGFDLGDYSGECEE